MRAADEYQSPALPDFHLSQLRQLRPFRAGKLLQGRVPVAELLWHTEFLFVTIQMQILVFRSAHQVLLLLKQPLDLHVVDSDAMSRTGVRHEDVLQECQLLRQ